MSRKVKVEIKVYLTMAVDEGVEVSRIIDELDYTFLDTTTQAKVEDSEIVDYEII